MTSDQLHNLLVAAFLAGVERCMEPIAPEVEQRLIAGGPEIVAAHMSGSARMYAEKVLAQPATKAIIKG